MKNYPIVKNMVSPHTGRAVANQFVISSCDTYTFQSYDSTIAFLMDDNIILGRNWDYSVTTMKYLYAFLKKYANLPGLNAAKVRKMIESGEILYDDSMA